MKLKKQIGGWLQLAILVAGLVTAPLTCQGALDDCVNLPFYESFESYGVDVVDPGPWTYLSNGVTAKVSNDKPNAWWPRSGEKSLYVEGRPGWARTEYVKVPTPLGGLSYEATVYVQSGDVSVGFMYWDPDPQNPNQVPMNDRFRFGHSGLISWEGRSGTPLGTWNPGDIYRVRAEIDGASQTADVYLFNVKTGDWRYILDAEATWPTAGDPWYVPLDQFGIAAGGMGAASAAYIDDVFITPEPGTIALLGLGGLSLLRRRRKE